MPAGLRRRPAAQLDLRRGRLLPHVGHRRAGGPAVRDRRPHVGARERRDQPIGGAAALARAERRRPPPPAAGHAAVAHRWWAWSEDVMQNGFRDTPQALVYYPLVGPTPTSWCITTPAYVLKTTRAEVIAPEVRALIREVAPEAPMYRVFTMAGLAADSLVDAVVHPAHPRHRVRAGALPGRGGPLRRALVRGRRAHAGDRRPDGPRRAPSARCDAWWSRRARAWSLSASRSASAAAFVATRGARRAALRCRRRRTARPSRRWLS
mgnify:CR=1 FL=1